MPKATLKAQIELVAVEQNPIDLHWQDRPAPSSAPITLFSNESAGKTSLQNVLKLAPLVKKPVGMLL